MRRPVQEMSKTGNVLRSDEPCHGCAIQAYRSGGDGGGGGGGGFGGL
jgi:hypothetical protein